VVLESKFGSPRIVNDGVTVAKEVDLEDAVENIGAKLVRQVCIVDLIQSKRALYYERVGTPNAEIVGGQIAGSVGMT